MVTQQEQAGLRGTATIAFPGTEAPGNGSAAMLRPGILYGLTKAPIPLSGRTVLSML